jgi:hypothetical protein
MGLPFVSQYGLNYTMGKNWTLSAGYNSLDISSGEAGVALTVPEVVFQWHPFGGSFYLGFGVGQETLEASATDTATSLSISAEVTATVAIAKLGWMWGKDNGGFWFGMDVAMYSPSGGEVEVDAPGVALSSEEYQDVVDAGEQFGETAYMNITFARLGYLF